MNIVTISNEKWIDLHGHRWARFARASNPNAKLFLIYIGHMDKHPVMDMFDKVVYYPPERDYRDWYNIVRLKAAKLFDIDEYLYCDLDADILQDMSGIAKQPGDILWVRSPAVSQEFRELCKENGWNEWGANNGLLYIRKDYSQRYEEILQGLKDKGCSPRLVGTYAFNALVRESPAFGESAYYHSVIWWDYQNLCTAKTIQWCNDEGQAKRLMLEQEWRNAL